MFSFVSGADSHARNRFRIRHFRDAQNHARRQPFLRKNEIAAANNRAIADNAAVAKSRVRFQKICAAEVSVFRRRATKIAAHARIPACRLECSSANDRQIKRIDQQFGLKFLLKSGARIDHNFSRHRIGRVRSNSRTRAVTGPSFSGGICASFHVTAGALIWKNVKRNSWRARMKNCEAGKTIAASFG